MIDREGSQGFPHPRRTSRQRAIAAARGLLALWMGAVGCGSAARAGVDEWSSAAPSRAPVTSLALDPHHSGHLYAGTAGDGVHASCDHGATWQAVNVGLGAIYVDAVLVDPVRPDTVYAASPNRGVFKSVDGGHHWASANDGLPGHSAHHLAIDRDRGVLFASTDEGVFRSYDAGDSWQSTRLRLGVGETESSNPALGAWIDCLAVDPDAAAQYACLFNWGADSGLVWQLLRSTDAGVTWHAVPLPGNGGPLAITIAADRLYVVTYDPYGSTSAILESSVAWATWDSVGTDMPGCGPDCRVNAVAVGPGAELPAFAATDRGVYRRTDNGSASWQPLAAGMGDRAVDDVAFDGRFVYAASGDSVLAMDTAPSCAGDCDGDGTVTVAELVSLVQIGMERRPMTACAAADSAGEVQLTVSDLVAAVASALHGCQATARS